MLLKGKLKEIKPKKPDTARLKARYAAYRKRQSRTPGGALKIKNYRDWLMDQGIDLNDLD